MSWIASTRPRGLAAVALLGLLAAGCPAATEEDPANTPPSLTQQCEAGRGEACMLLAADLRDRQGEAAALPYSIRACDADVAEACEALAAHCPSTPAVSEVPGRGRRMGEACRSRRQAALRAVEFELRKDRPAIRDTLDRACALRSAPACASLGQLELEDGRHDQARVSLHRGCALESALSCHRLALIFRQGLGVPIDEDYASKQLERACSLGHRDSCDPDP